MLLRGVCVFPFSFERFAEGGDSSSMVSNKSWMQYQGRAFASSQLFIRGILIMYQRSSVILFKTTAEVEYKRNEGILSAGQCFSHTNQ